MLWKWCVWRKACLGPRIKFQELPFLEFVEEILLGQILGAIKPLTALAATIRAIGQEEQDPKFKKASALGAMHVVAAAQRTLSFLGVHEHPKGAFH